MALVLAEYWCSRHHGRQCGTHQQLLLYKYGQRQHNSLQVKLRTGFPEITSCLQDVVKVMIDVLIRADFQRKPDIIDSSSPLCPTSSDFSQVGLGPADMSSLHPRILALVLLWLDSAEAGAHYWRHVTPLLSSWWAKQIHHVHETGMVQDLKPYAVALGMSQQSGDCIRPRPPGADLAASQLSHLPGVCLSC